MAKQPEQTGPPCPACGKPMDENMFCAHCAVPSDEPTDQARHEAEAYEDYRRSQM